jgi:threonine dehydrogenase-like Zn-dependent dehydrogenase
VYERLANGVDFQDQHRREITIYGSSGAPDTFSRAVELVASGQIQLGFMATHRLRLDDVPPLLAARLAPDENDPRLKSVVVMAEEMA